MCSQHYKVFELGSEADDHDMARRVQQVGACCTCCTAQRGYSTHPCLQQARNAFASARAVNNYCLTFIEFLEVRAWSIAIA